MDRKTKGWQVAAVSLAAIVLLVGIFSLGIGKPWNGRELDIIHKSDSVMYVTVLPQDSAVLRTPSRNLSRKALKSKDLQMLLEKMLRTVQDPSQDGVGIAAPQVGINRRVIWVQRMDKPGEPFECYVNVQLDSLFGNITHGPEGCLSVPPKRGYVPRYSGVIVSYINPLTGESCREKVEGYTAIIFQHECDHLDGRLYIDRADTVFTDSTWAAERAAFSYKKPID